MIRRLTLSIVVSFAVLAPGLCMAQGGGGGAVATPPVPDSIAVIGQRRVTPATIIQTSGLVVGRALNYREVLHLLDGFRSLRAARKRARERLMWLMEERHGWPALATADALNTKAGLGMGQATADLHFLLGNDRRRFPRPDGNDPVLQSVASAARAARAKCRTRKSVWRTRSAAAPTPAS